MLQVAVNDDEMLSAGDANQRTGELMPPIPNLHRIGRSIFITMLGQRRLAWRARENRDAYIGKVQRFRRRHKPPAFPANSARASAIGPATECRISAGLTPCCKSKL